jgi:hypothetical protein
MPTDFDDAFELHTFDPAAGPRPPPGIGAPPTPGAPPSGNAGLAPSGISAPSPAPASALSGAISFAAARAGARLLDLLMGKFRLSEHLHNLKAYLLLGKGDFVQGLMEPLLPQLSKPASQLHRHHVSSNAPLTYPSPMVIQTLLPPDNPPCGIAFFCLS